MYVADTAPIHWAPPWDLPFDERFARLVAGSPRAAYFYSVPDTSTFRYRAYNISLALRPPCSRASACWFTSADFERIERVLDSCDVLVLCRNSLYDEKVARIAALARARSRRILFDVDDLVFDPAYVHLLVNTLGVDAADPETWNYWHAYVGRVGATFRLCDGALVTNTVLARHATAWSGKPASVVPNFLNPEQEAVSEEVWRAKERTGWRRDGRTHIAYFSGSPSHDRDFDLVAGPVARLMDRNPSLVLRVVGFLSPHPEIARHAARTEVLPLQDFLNLQREKGRVEISVVPLQENPFTECKSELKWFEAAITGTLTLASPTHAYRGAVEHGRTGWLVDAQGWEDTLAETIASLDALRDRTAPAAREQALARYGWRNQAATIEAALFGDSRNPAPARRVGVSPPLAPAERRPAPPAPVAPG